MSLTGGCLCGEIQYASSEPLAMMAVCHCKSCQRQSGSAYSTIGAVAKATFELTRGEPKLYEDGSAESGGSVERWFCGNCGSPIYSVLAGQPEILALKTGTLDDTADFQPAVHVWCRSKQNWVDIAENAMQIATQES